MVMTKLKDDCSSCSDARPLKKKKIEIIHSPLWFLSTTRKQEEKTDKDTQSFFSTSFPLEDCFQKPFSFFFFSFPPSLWKTAFRTFFFFLTSFPLEDSFQSLEFVEVDPLVFLVFSHYHCVTWKTKSATVINTWKKRRIAQVHAIKHSDAHFNWFPATDRLKSQKTNCSNPPQDLGLIKIQFWWSHVPLFLWCHGQACYYFPTKFKPWFRTQSQFMIRSNFTAAVPGLTVSDLNFNFSCFVHNHGSCFLRVWCPTVFASSGHCVLLKFGL